MPVQVVEKPEKDAASFICSMIRARFKAAHSGIIYCQTRKECESLAAALAAEGVPAAFYHADMEPAAREATHRQWSQGGSVLLTSMPELGIWALQEGSVVCVQAVCRSLWPRWLSAWASIGWTCAGSCTLVRPLLGSSMQR